MKAKLILLSGLTAIALAACQNDDTATKESSDTKQSAQVTSEEKTTDQKEVKKENEKVTTKEKDQEEKIEKKEVTAKQTDEKDKKDKDDKSRVLKAEDTIVNYFNAISLGDVATLQKIYPAGTEENQQLGKMFQSSKVTADIINMKKVTVNSKEAQYKVKVKIYTKQDDSNFTDNVSDYEVTLDMNNGTIKTKSITSTDYLE
ncbi:hypothetical protein O0Q50_20390 [Priestia aryabhattai]|uniref:Lipoprotein n=1 Tax=Priestia aryabhattai TaxID=412384 RepID=A0AAX6NCJ9_PRIAR|nr:hypothetical protein [Priestia aryabhattai]MDU9693539.1 hypothetical protein [Priestia aryabhattai]